MSRQPIRSNVICPPAEETVTFDTTGADQYVVLDGVGLDRYLVQVSAAEDAIVDVEEGVDGVVWTRAANVDAQVFPVTVTGGTPFVVRGPLYGRQLRVSIKQDSAPGAATVVVFIQ